MTAFFLGLSLFVAAAASSLVLRRPDARRDGVYAGLILAGAALASLPAFPLLLRGGSLSVRWPAALPGGDWVIGLDPLSAAFLLVVLAIGAAGALAGGPYMRADPHHPTRPWRGAYALLLVALTVVVTARTVVLFLTAWELMAIGSYLLIVTEHEHASVRRAGLLYLVVTHASTLLLFVMFAVWTRHTSDWSFAALAAARPALAGDQARLFLLALAAFGIKAGLVPFHFWLPPAHSAAPSHVSAMMSGVVIKTGIYGLLRVISLAGAPPGWVGWTVLGLGAASALLGVLWALAQHDMKRLLAYHSVENIGIIVIGLGLGSLGIAYAHPLLAMLGFGAAVLHTLNHALFKGLLFLSAGAVYRATGTRNLEELGGLARHMPVTCFAFLVGSVAIVGLPPLNGFVSEWLVFQGLFRAGQATQGLRLALLGAPVLALVGGLALTCFTKATGVIFLGTPRSERPAREVTPEFLAPLMALAAVCIAIGLAPVAFVRPALRVGALVAGQPVDASDPGLRGVLLDAQRVALFAATVLVISAVLWFVHRGLFRHRPIRVAETWGCGYGAASSRMQYTASSFAAPTLAVFSGLTGVREHRGATVFHSIPLDLVLDRAVLPFWALVQRLALRLRPMQQGRLHLYLLYIVAALLALLGYLVAAPGGK
jgi:formate hydrogenlyase subunit 3/multisubunit Na+/H+ antiporter MnhD subunit